MSAYEAAVRLVLAADQYRVLWRAGRDTPYDVEHVVAATAAWNGGTWPREINRWQKHRERAR